MSDRTPFVRMSNLDVGGFAEHTWHVVLCGLPTRITALEYPTSWMWTDRASFLETRAEAYRVAQSLAESLGVRFVEEFDPYGVGGQPLAGVEEQKAALGDLCA